MRKSKEIKRKRREAAIEYRKGNSAEAYKMWTQAKKEMQQLRAPAKPAAAPPPAPAQ